MTQSHSVVAEQEFVTVAVTPVLNAGGRLVNATRRRRMEVRMVGFWYQLFLVDRLYVPGQPPVDVYEVRHNAEAPLIFSDFVTAGSELMRFTAEWCQGSGSR